MSECQTMPVVWVRDKRYDTGIHSRKGGRNMAFNKDGEEPKRFYRGKSLRLPKHDYSWTRAYFVTGCAITRDPIFEIPALHTILQETWDALPARFPGVTLDAFVIMPDHILSRFHERVMRDNHEVAIYRRYIRENPEKLE